MVEKEFAILFKRKNIDASTQEFIPYKVIEGKFNDLDCSFLDKSDISYQHIAEMNFSGIAYASRVKIERTAEDFTNINVETIKKDLLEFASRFTYIRNTKEGPYVMTANKDNPNNKIIYSDEDTPRIYNFHETENKQYEEIKLTLTPKEISQNIKETIKGQDEAIKTIGTVIWTAKNKDLNVQNMLVIGPTGVGKTAIFKKLQKSLGIPVHIASIPGLSQAGYEGRNVDEILLEAYYNCNKDINLTEHSIIILDEIDKISANQSAQEGVSSTGVQNELLKIIEGCTRTIFLRNEFGGEKPITIDTSKIIFVGVGAFSEIYEKSKNKIGFQNEETEKTKITIDSLVEYGMKEELLGRLPIIVELNSLTKENLKDIILNSDESIYKKIIKAIEDEGVTIDNQEEFIDMIAEDAIKRKIGARGLVATITNLTLDIFYEIASEKNKYQKVIIGKNIINDPKDYLLIVRNKSTVKVRKRT